MSIVSTRKAATYVVALVAVARGALGQTECPADTTACNGSGHPTMEQMSYGVGE